MTVPDRPAFKRSDVIHLVGGVDDMTVTAITDAGTTYLDIERAVRWMTGTAADRAERHPLEGPALTVNDILAASPEFSSDRER